VGFNSSNKRFRVRSPPTLKNQLLSWFDDKEQSSKAVKTSLKNNLGASH